MQTVPISIKLFDTSLPVPEYQTNGAAGFDLYARETIIVPPRTVGKVPLNIAIQLPEGYWAMLVARSSLHKVGVMMANGLGVGDYDYRGDGDEYQAALFNFTQKEVIIEKGSRIVQMIIMPNIRADLKVEERFEEKNRGGFGSTGK